MTHHGDGGWEFRCMRAIITTLVLLSTSTGYGCTVCDSPAGSSMRAGIFNDSFLVTLIEVLAPFPVLGLALYLLNRCLPD
jgi:hypothetical protein